MERLTLLGLPLDPVDMEEALKRIGASSKRKGPTRW